MQKFEREKILKIESKNNFRLHLTLLLEKHTTQIQVYPHKLRADAAHALLVLLFTCVLCYISAAFVVLGFGFGFALLGSLKCWRREKKKQKAMFKRRCIACIA